MAIIAPDIGIDLGTSNTLVYVKHKGVVLNEPTLMVVTGGQKKSVKAFGEDARLMLGRTTGEYQSVRPLEDGVIKDYDMTEYMLEFFIRKAIGISACSPARADYHPQPRHGHRTPRRARGRRECRHPQGRAAPD